MTTHLPGLPGVEPRVAILGSCVSRDLVSFLREDNEVAVYIARQSLISTMGAPVRWDAEVPLASAFQRRMVLSDLTSGGLDAVNAVAGDVDILLVDLVDERLGVLPLGEGRFATASLELAQSGLIELLPTASQALQVGDRIHVALWRDAADRFLEGLDARLRERLWVVVAPFATRTSDHGRVPPFRSRSTTDWNRRYRRYYAHLARRGVRMVTIPKEHAIADIDHRWGIGANHYVPGAYQALAAQLQWDTPG